jgi:hypothetical protein
MDRTEPLTRFANCDKLPTWSRNILVVFLFCWLVGLCFMSSTASTSMTVEQAVVASKFFRRRLIQAAREGQASFVQDLLARGVPVDGCGKSGRTALHYAAREGHVKVCHVLVEAGANVNAANKWKETPLHAGGLQQKSNVRNLSQTCLFSRLQRSPRSV